VTSDCLNNLNAGAQLTLQVGGSQNMETLASIKKVGYVSSISYFFLYNNQKYKLNFLDFIEANALE
jgi:hypothetical protein